MADDGRGQERALRVLSLEDSADDAELLNRALEKGGLHVLFRRVWTRRDFLRELEENRPDLVIADYSIPSYSGMAALADIQEHCPDIPFIFLSGTIGEEFAIETLRRGATDYVLKDNLSRLVPSIRRAMKESEERRVRFAAEESLRESEEKFKGLAASARDAIIMIDSEGRISFWNEAAERVFGYASSEVLGRDMHALLAPPRHIEEFSRGFRSFRDTGEGPFLGRLLDLSAVRKDGTEFPVEFSVSALRYKGEWHAISILRDVTERKRAEELVRQQLDNMIALRDIGVAINSSLDLKATLNVLLEKLMGLLGVDAADVLLLDRDSLYLNYSAGRGFRTPTVQATHVRLGKGHAGRAAYERQSLIITNLTESLTHALRGEEFEAYIAVPLIARGNVTGVLEIFQRKPLKPTREWMELLELLAGQAAIAIDNASLFDSLQRFATELTLSYDTTLEGWGRTLEFRDEDTRGHTERVTEMTVRLARLLGVEGQELVHVRRGALLHDIGKISIPDSILLKRGPLTPEESAIMQMHTVYARELLSPIPFLRPAIDIPYCHHEKWDGSGYPRGLKGEEIPFKARIFAVVDVADALISDRPYRPAWPAEKVAEYIESLRGVHFDPQVADVFLAMQRDGEVRAV